MCHHARHASLFGEILLIEVRLVNLVVHIDSFIHSKQDHSLALKHLLRGIASCQSILKVLPHFEQIRHYLGVLGGKSSVRVIFQGQVQRQREVVKQFVAS